MKIASVEAFAIHAEPPGGAAYWGSRAWGKEQKHREISTEYPPPQRRRYIYSRTIDTVAVKITTEDGRVGYGEAKAPVAPEVTKQIIDLLLRPIVIGADPRDVTLLWERMYAGMRVRGHAGGFYLEAISGIDIALWDLAAQSAGVPLWRMLGGAFRNPVRVYASGLPAAPSDACEDDFEELAAEAVRIREGGYTGLKIAIGRGIEGDLRSIRTVRDRLGSEFLIYADAAGVYDRAQAMLVGRRLEDLGVAWFEMPIFPEDVDGYAELAKALTIPIALDSLTSRYQARDFIVRGGLDVVQPDVCRAGGITECRRIAELADAFGLAFAPHVSIGSALHFAATVHLGVAMPNTITCEYWIGENPIGNRILEQPLRLENGYLYAPDGPGLGVRVKEDALLHSA